MYRHFHYAIVLLLPLFLLWSCATVDDGVGVDTSATYDSTRPLFQAWQPARTPAKAVAASKAIESLLQQADRLIAGNALEQAAVKLERLLRIEPGYAQAWSRLAWIALHSDAPERGRQMAQRSISYAASDSELMLLNWQFIREAGELMQDEGLMREAERNMRELGGML